MRKDFYAQDGVDVAAGDSFSAFAGRICQNSWHNSRYVNVKDLSAGYFRGVRSLTFRDLPDDWSVDMATDGTGTKCLVTQAAMANHMAAYDVLAMCTGDITRNGGVPVVFVNDLSVSSLDEEGSEVNLRYRSMIKALGDAAADLDLVLFRGETAELGCCVGTEDGQDSKGAFYWSGTALGIYSDNLMITGNDIQDGDIIVALREYGLRANGVSSARKAFKMRFGNQWFNEPEAEEFIKQAAAPSVLYDKFLTTTNGWYSPDFTPEVKVKGLIHVTGGAFEGKLGDDILFRRGLSAELDDLWQPPSIVQNLKEWRGMDDEDAYATWNCGQGVLAILSPGDADDFIRNASTHGHESKRCGFITTKDQPQVRIVSQFSGKEIVYAA